uniref:Biotin--protein ligase n=1 Tax=Culex pipiens TaxID=7175 RepID=A0A8D8C2V0_CULPI
MFNSARSLVSANLHRKQLFQYQLNTFRCQLGRRIDHNNSVTMSTSSKPPNILVYSEVEPVRLELISTLQRSLEPDRYTVYPLSAEQVRGRAWPDSTAALIVHGRLETSLAGVFADYFLNGGKLLGVCSDVTRLFDCGEVGGVTRVTKHLRDLRGEDHEVQVEVIAREDTSRTVSIVAVDELKTCGRAISTQIEFVPFEDNKKNLEILKHVLSSELGIKFKTSHDEEALCYQSAFLIGSEEVKRSFLSKLSIPNELKVGDLTLQFCSKSALIPAASESQLPVLTDQPPEDFSTQLFHDHLQTTKIGRLTLYLPLVTSSMIIVSNATLPHGFVAIPRRQTRGTGRNRNQWLSPDGCAMFSLQLHVPMDSPLGQRLPMVQHLIALGIVLGIRNQPGYGELDVRLKWPNDVYANGRSKLGGIIVNSQLEGSRAVVNVGCGVNLSNSAPTTCVNDVIKEFNRERGERLEALGYEQLLAQIFNEIERIFDEVQRGKTEVFYDLYRRYWLHEGQSVTVRDKDGLDVTGTVAGIDEYGYLLVKVDGAREPICVHPNGNSFDMMKGLIIPKYC